MEIFIWFVWEKDIFLLVERKTDIYLFEKKKYLFVWEKKIFICLRNRYSFVWRKRNLLVWEIVWRKRNLFALRKEIYLFEKKDIYLFEKKKDNPKKFLTAVMAFVNALFVCLFEDLKPVNGTINSTSSQAAFVGSIHNTIDFKCCYVTIVKTYFLVDFLKARKKTKKKNKKIIRFIFWDTFLGRGIFFFFFTKKIFFLFYFIFFFYTGLNGKRAFAFGSIFKLAFA